jgi:eukaryotic-like serine/threonine-protein kinase
LALAPGTRLGVYQVTAQLGVGGMGEVYRATDTKLKRQVAIKILPSSLGADLDRLARFQREAEVLASLNHPNIAAIYGLEDADGQKALVMELVEGEDLAQRIARGAIPLVEALPIATQIAEALEAAHEQGIIHRDLKPGNIKVREDGTVKVLDFGLAKAMEPTVGSFPSVSHSPTITTPAMTQAGMILGTAAYMAPEQAKGRTADKRSDVWSFGCVLYEMLTGRRAFEGEDVSDTLASVLKSEPDWNALPADVAPPVRTLVQRCLAKDRRQRVGQISTASFVMNESASLVSAAPVHPVGVLSRLPLWRRVVVPAAALIVGGASVGVSVWLATRPGDPDVTRFTLSRTGAGALAVDSQSRDLTITPDGTHIVYKGTATNGTGTQLFVRALDQLELTPLTALGQVPRSPFSSPDGRWIGFVEVGTPVRLRKVAMSGGPTFLLSDLDGASRGATWGDDDSIIFATAETSTGLQRVSSDGGAPTVLTKPNRERGESDHLWPQFLPGSQAVLFTITATTGGIDASQVAVLDLSTGTQKVLLRGGSQAYYVPSGHLVYVAAGTLRAVTFNLKRLEATGTAISVLSQVTTLQTGTAEFDIARNGTLVYVAGGAGAMARTLAWVDRQGREEEIKAVPARPYSSPRLSPDGTRVALDIRDQENDIWVLDFARETLIRVTSDAGIDQGPVWMPDGRRLVFSSQAGGTVGSLFWQAADGTGKAERLTEARNFQRPSDVLADGTRVLFSGFTGFAGPAATAIDVMMLTLEKDRPVQPLVQSPLIDAFGVISPDGRWLAYQSNDSGQFQIVVRPFPNVNDCKTQVSTGGGTEPRWRGNSEELFYFAPNGALMSVPVERGTTWRAGAPIKLFDVPYRRSEVSTSQSYDVSPDGKRFLMIKEGSGADPTPPTIEVVQNWFEELKRVVPTK